MRLIDADTLIRSTIYNPLHVPYITKTDIETAPTLETEPQWIPCSERLPDTLKNVLVSVAGDDECIPYIAVAHMYERDRWYETFYCERIGNEVLAWMPLPELYEGAKDETD